MLAGCTEGATPPGISVSVTYVNYLPTKIVRNVEVRTDQGYQMMGPGVLIPSTNRYTGATVSSTDPGGRVPEWVDFAWKEFELADDISNEAWAKLDEGEKQAYLQKRRATPPKRQRVAVRKLVPADVLNELAQAPTDPELAGLRQKELRLYFIWAGDGLKVHWKVYRGCCTVIHEGGDIVLQRG